MKEVYRLLIKLVLVSISQHAYQIKRFYIHELMGNGLPCQIKQIVRLSTICQRTNCFLVLK
ncbi:hypothetical protein BCN_5012 [Bacillus cereus NC7401]|nr:hypothetical protein BCN_5012 [Bacillus cereus NC7401]